MGLLSPLAAFTATKITSWRWLNWPPSAVKKIYLHAFRWDAIRHPRSAKGSLQAFEEKFAAGYA